MMSRHGGPAVLAWRLVVALALLANLALAADTVSIQSEDGYKVLRSCAQKCVAYFGLNDLQSKLGCGGNPFQNECLCRTDLASAANKHLSTCCDAACTVGPSNGDITSAISVYDSYCLANGYDVTAAANLAPAKATPTNQGTFATSSRAGA